MLNRQWTSWLCFRGCYASLPAEQRPDFVLVPYFDDIEFSAAAFGSPFGSTPWGGITMRDRFHQHAVNAFTPLAPLSKWRRFAFERNLRSPTLGGLITIDETLTEFYCVRKEPQPKLRFAGEPADLAFTIPKEEARRRLGIPEDGCYILLYGQPNMRKGLAEAITAIDGLPRELGARLLLFGPQAPGESAYIARHAAGLRASGHLFDFKKFASMEDESLVFSAADIVWVGYSRHYGPSSVQCKGCRAGCPLISCREGNLGWTTSRYGLGLVVDVHDPAAVHKALLELVQGGQKEWTGYKENALRYVRQRSGDDFGDAVIRMAEESVASVEPAVHMR
jgi:glycosyltransferase involved in cell wall biosynthesis